MDQRDLCHNQLCRSPLGHYAHQTRAGTFCSATCAVKFQREERWKQRISNFFSVSDPLAATFYGATNERKAQAATEKTRTEIATEAIATLSFGLGVSLAILS